MATDRRSVLSICRSVLSEVEGAETLAMADWLAPLSDGRTLKQRYAEAAALAWTLDRGLGGQSSAGDVSGPAASPDRARRPALMLVRELRECLGRVLTRLDTQTDVTATHATVLDEIERLTRLTMGGNPP